MTSLINSLDPAELARLSAASGKRYSDDELLQQLAECAQRLGKSPTMREFESDPETTVHPQTIIARFDSWNAAKRKAGLRPRRLASDNELLAPLRLLGSELGRVPEAKDLAAYQRQSYMPGLSTYIKRFGTFAKALQRAGFDVPATADEKLMAAVRQGASVAAEIGHVPNMAEWTKLREDGRELISEWKIYRLCKNEHGSAWAAFHLLVERELQASAATAAA